MKEYRIIDPRPRRQRIDVYRLEVHGQYQVVLPAMNGAIHSVVLPGFWIQPDWLWADPGPAPLDLFQDMLASLPTEHDS